MSCPICFSFLCTYASFPLGVPRPWYYPVTPSYWQEVCGCCGRPKRGHESLLTPDRMSTHPKHAAGASSVPTWLQWIPGFRPRPVFMPNRNPRADASFFEQPDANLVAKEREGKTVRIKKLCKQFDTPDGIKVAVDEVDMTMYEGQIYVLLGHNGAGAELQIETV